MTQNIRKLFRERLSNAVKKENASSNKNKFDEVCRICCRIFLTNKTDQRFRKNAPIEFGSNRISFVSRDNNEEGSGQSEKASKELGVQINGKLNCNWHNFELRSKLSKFSGLFLFRAQLLMTYKVYVKPKLSFGILVYGTSNKATRHPLKRKKNKCLDSSSL